MASMVADPTGLIAPHFAFLTGEYGFVVTKSEVSRSFDNAYVVLSSGELQVRIVRDRGRVDVNVGRAGPPEVWFGLELIRAGAVPGDLDKPVAVEVLADFLKENFAAVRDSFSEDNYPGTAAHLGELAKRRAESMFPRWFPKPGPDPGDTSR
jgi:hypothetical protein